MGEGGGGGGGAVPHFFRPRKGTFKHQLFVKFNNFGRYRFAHLKNPGKESC